jgi:hypothetical protein
VDSELDCLLIPANVFYTYEAEIEADVVDDEAVGTNHTAEHIPKVAVRLVEELPLEGFWSGANMWASLDVS